MQIRILSSPAIKRLNALVLLVSPPGVQRLLRLSTSQSQKKPYLLNSVVSNEPPIERSGTATMAFLTPWLYSLSNAKNINARDLPDAGGAFNRRYWLFLASYARDCIARMPMSFVFELAPLWAYLNSIKLRILLALHFRVHKKTCYQYQTTHNQLIRPMVV